MKTIDQEGNVIIEPEPDNAVFSTLLALGGAYVLYKLDKYCKEQKEINKKDHS